MEWDDLRYALAVADAGSLAGGARQLGVNHTTVMRRIAAFEARHGVRLFERLPGGYALTAAGEDLIETARQIGGSVASMERRLAGSETQASGVVRITTTDTLMASLLPAIFHALKHEHPGIEVHLGTSNLVVDLSRREADIAIRPAENPPLGLFGRRVSSIGFAIYGAASRHSGPLALEALREQAWVGPDDSLTATAVSRWMRAELPDAEVAIRAGSMVMMKLLAETGLGVVALPCYLGDTAPGLRRLTPAIDAMRTGLWVLTHEDLHRSARIRVVMEFVAARLVERKRLIEG